MIKKDYLWLPLLVWILTDEDVTRVGIAVDEAVLKYHFGEDLDQNGACFNRSSFSKLGFDCV